MVRVPCCEKMGLKKGPWTPEEDHILISYVERYGHENWRAIPKQAGLLRCGKSCRLRWTNYLRPDIKRGNFSKEEEEAIIKLHQMLGNRWSAIATRLPGRTDNEIKNYWHTHLKKRAEHNLANPKILRCSSVQTPIFRASNQRIPQSCTSSNHLVFQSSGYEQYSTPTIHKNIFALDPWVATSWQSTQEGCMQANESDAETNGKGTAQEFSTANKAPDALDPETRLQNLSAGQSILQSGEDRINSDMIFWYNLFLNAGRSQDSQENCRTSY